MPRDGPLSGKTAIVTGSSKVDGIGAATAIALAHEGANVVIHYSASAEGAKSVVESVQAMGVGAVAVQADATSPDFGEKLVQGTLNSFKTSTIDIIVNNAGTAAVHPTITDVPVEAWDDVFHTNVRAPFLLIQAALPYIPSGGRIVNISSVVAKMGNKMLTVYGASKAALTSSAVAMAEELGPKGITINVVAPGPITTSMSMKGSPIFAKLQNNAHIKREGRPEEVANAIVWLASPNAGYVTGQLIAVDGGITWP